MARLYYSDVICISVSEPLLNGIDVYTGGSYIWKKHIQLTLTLVISKLKGPSEALRDIRTLTYQIFRIEENTNRTTKLHK